MAAVQGALMELVATTARAGPGFSPRVDTLMTCSTETLTQFGQTTSFQMLRQADQIMETYLAIRIGPLPAACGWTWRPHMPHLLLSNWELQIGGQRILGQTGDGATAWAVSHTLRDEETYEPAADGSYEFLLPLEHPTIHLIRLGFHNVQFALTTASLAELVVPDPAVAGADRLPPGALEGLVEKSFTLRHRVRYLDAEERRALATTNREDLFFASACETVYPFVPAAGESVVLKLDTSVLAFSGFLHILDEHGKEIPTSCLESIRLNLNATERFTISGLEARTAMKAQLSPDAQPVLNVFKSANVYCINYGTGQTRPDKRREGIEFGRIDHATLELKFKLGFAGQKVRVAVLHRYTNLLKFHHGMGGNWWTYHYQIRCCSAVWKETARPGERAFGTELEDGIPLLEGDTCPISYDNLAVGQDVCMCGTCKKVFGLESMQTWFGSQDRNAKSCPACRTAFTQDNFFRGKGRAGSEEERAPAAVVRPAAVAPAPGLRHRGGAAVAPAPAATAEAEGAPLIQPAHDIYVGPPREPRGLLQWIAGWFAS
jgi:hypothetical protein